MTKKINKEELRKRCEGLIKQTVTRKVERISDKSIMRVLREDGKVLMAPKFKFTYKQNRGYSIKRVFLKYLEFLIDESLKYPIHIYIPFIGKLKIFEIDSIGKRRCWNDNGVFKYRFDTPFDKSVMYRVYHDIFGMENNHFSTPFRLDRIFASRLLGKVYQKHPDGGFYNLYIKNKK